MSDTTLNRFLGQGTHAERLAFTPNPPTPASGPDPGYLFYETDTDSLWAYDDVGAVWTQITSGTPFVNPMTTSQDLIVGGVAGAPGRLGVGAVGRVLTVGSGGIIDWEATAPVGGAITASGYTMATAKMLGRATAGTGAIEEIAVTGSGSAVLATSPTLVTPALGTPSALVLTNATGLPLGSITGFAANIATFLATPSSANLAAAVTDETGTGLLVFGTAPTFASTMTIGTAGGTTGAINLKGTTSGTFTMSVNDAAGTWTAKWPATAGSNTNVLTTDGSGNLSWAATSSGSGTVNSGTATQFAYYPATAAAVSGTPTITVGSTGRLTLTPTVITTGSTAALIFTGPADTTLSAAESNAILINSATRQWASNPTIALQREYYFRRPTLAFAVAGGIFTTAATLTIEGAPAAGTNATLTNAYAIQVESGDINLATGILKFNSSALSAISQSSGLLTVASVGGINFTGGSIFSVSGTSSDVVISDNSSFKSWQGDSARIGYGAYVQRAAIPAQFNALAVGTGQNVAFYGQMCNGSYGSLSATETGRTVTFGIRTYGGTTWLTQAGIIITTTETQSETARGCKITLAPISNTTTVAIAGWVVDQDGSCKSPSPTAGIGYATGAGGVATQATNRTTGVTINKVCGALQLVSAAGSVLFQSFTVTNSVVLALDYVMCTQKNGTDLYEIHVTNIVNGSFQVTYRTTGGTTTEQPVFNFAIFRMVAS